MVQFNMEVASNQTVPFWRTSTKNYSEWLNETENESLSITSHPYHMMLNHVWTTAFSIMVIIGMFGNGSVLWIILGHRSMWNTTNYLLVNLSIADLMMTLLNTLFNFILMRDNQWPFGVPYCYINNFVAFMTVSASTLTLTAITVERYRAIMFPLKPKLKRKVLLRTIFGIWTFSCILASPALFVSHVYTTQEFSTCVMSWPDGVAHHSKVDFIYNIFFIIITYFAPLILMLYCFIKMGTKLWGSSIVGERNDGQIVNHKKKRRVVKMFIVVFSLFALCWLPYHLYFIVVYLYNEIARWPWTRHVYLTFYFFAMSNAIVNPMIYFTMNAKFRSFLCEPIKGLYGYLVCRPSADPEPDSLPMLSGVPKSKSCGTMNLTILTSVESSRKNYKKCMEYSSSKTEKYYNTKLVEPTSSSTTTTSTTTNKKLTEIFQHKNILDVKCKVTTEKSWNILVANNAQTLFADMEDADDGPTFNFSRQYKSMPILKNYEFLEYSPKTSFKNSDQKQPIKRNVVVTWDGEEMSSEIFDSKPFSKTNIQKPVPRTRRNRRKMSEN